MAYNTEHLLRVGDAKTIYDSIERDIDDVGATYEQIQESEMANNWRLNESDGFCSSNSSYKLVKYKVASGFAVKVVSDDRFQFQTVKSVPTSGSNNRVGETYGAGVYVLDVPETATYLIVSTPVSDSEAAVYVKTYDLGKLAEKVGEVTKTGTFSVIPEATKHENQFYNSDNQIYSGGNQWDYYTMPVNPGDVFDIDTVAGGTVRAWAFRDDDGNQLTIESYSGDVVQKLYENVTAPAFASELIVNYKWVSGTLTITRKNGILINENRIIYDNHPLSYYLENANGRANVLHGKTLVCCGDSITYGADIGDEGIEDNPDIEVYQYSAYSKTWTQKSSDVPMSYGYQIANRNRMKFYNGGVSGATVQGSDLSGSEVQGFSAEDGEYTLLPETLDYLLLWYGWNDSAYGTLGEITDSTNDSFYGSYNIVLPYLIEKYPYAKIGLVVPFGTTAELREAVRLLGNKWGVAVFDNYQGGTPLYYGKEESVDVDASIVTANREKFQANGAHPNLAGHKQLADMIENWMRGI